jgi:hypothetical protein
LRFSLLALFIVVVPFHVEPFDLPAVSMRVNDAAGVLNPSYGRDLDRRLRRLNEKSGYEINIVLMAGDHSKSPIEIAWELFELNGLENSAAAGTVLLLITVQDGQVAIASSTNLRRKFSGSRAEYEIQNTLRQMAKQPEVAMEYVVHQVLARIDLWFYVLEPPAVHSDPDLLFVRSPMAEIILFPLAPFLGLMTGLVLMAFTTAGELPALGRFFVSGYAGCLVVVAAVFLIRQPGGISPGMFYYGVGASFVVSAAVGGLRPFWFNEQFKGRKAGDLTGPLYFRWG